MGQQLAGNVLYTDTGKDAGKGGLHDQRARLIEQLQRVNELLAQPDTLQRECDFHFKRAGLDAHGQMRRVELRRVLWTFAHGLGSTELTWEGIEAAAVVGTLEPHIPAATHSEFFRCVLKTVHLVAAELQKQINAIDAHFQLEEDHKRLATGAMRASAAASAAAASALESCGHEHTQDDVDAHAAHVPGPPSHDAQCGNPFVAEAGSVEEQFYHDSTDEEGEAGHAHRGMEMLGRNGRLPCDGANHAWQNEMEHEAKGASQEGLLFAPADGGAPEEVAPCINGMMALVLSNEGSFDPHRLFVGSGVLVLGDPEYPAPAFAGEFIIADGHSAFDLGFLESAVTGRALAHSPEASLLPEFAVRGKQSLDRMLVLTFEAGEALALWFNAPEDCALCLEAVRREVGGAPD